MAEISVFRNFNQKILRSAKKNSVFNLAVDLIDSNPEMYNVFEQNVVSSIHA